MKKKSFLIKVACVLLFPVFGFSAVRGTDSKICEAEAQINMRLLYAFNDNGVVETPKADFSDCSREVTFDYSKMNFLGECHVTVGDAHFKFDTSFDVENQVRNSTLQDNEKEFDSGFYIEDEVFTPSHIPYSAEHFSEVIANSSAAQIKFRHPISAVATEATHLAYQFYFETVVVDKGCTN